MANFATTSYQSLNAVASTWKQSATVPSDVAEMLNLSRKLFIHGYFIYELFTVAVVWSLLALEAAFKVRMGAGAARRGLTSLIREAKDQGLVSGENARRLEAGAQFRNVMVHPEKHAVLTPGMAEGLLATTHWMIADLFAFEEGTK
jgi:acid phosphatase family membrane protein YuiD